MSENNTSMPALVTVRTFVERHPWATESGLRSAILNRDVNDFAGCIVRFGKKVLLDEAKVIVWMRALGASGQSLSGSSTGRKGAK